MLICVTACACGQNQKFSGFSILAMPTIEIFRFLDVEHRHSAATENTTIKPNYASVRQSRYSLYRGTHKVTKKSRLRRALKPLELRSWKNSRRRVFWHTTINYACKFGLNRLRIDGDIRRKPL